MNVRGDVDTVTSPVSSEVTDTTTSEDGADDNTTVNVSVSPHSVTAASVFDTIVLPHVEVTARPVVPGESKALSWPFAKPRYRLVPDASGSVDLARIPVESS